MTAVKLTMWMKSLLSRCKPLPHLMQNNGKHEILNIYSVFVHCFNLCISHHPIYMTHPASIGASSGNSMGLMTSPLETIILVHHPSLIGANPSCRPWSGCLLVQHLALCPSLQGQLPLWTNRQKHPGHNWVKIIPGFRADGGPGSGKGSLSQALENPGGHQTMELSTHMRPSTL